MKTIKLLTAIAFIAVFSLGCKKVLKNPEDYYPEVEMVSATVQPDGSVLVEGRVVSPGKYEGSEITHVGFCMKKGSEPAMVENQIEGVLQGDKFTAIYPQFYIDDNATHYFSAFATNDFGYDLSSALGFDSLYLDITPPCTINDMYYNCAGNSGYYDGVTVSSETYFIANHGNNRFYIEFPSAIHAGVYTTFTYPSSPNKVRCTVQIGNQYPVSNDQEVYVEKINSTSYRVTVCGANVPIGSGSSTYTGSFIINM